MITDTMKVVVIREPGTGHQYVSGPENVWEMKDNTAGGKIVVLTGREE